MSIIRLGLLLVIISMLSGCCCLWYVAVEEPSVFSGHKMKGKNQTIQNSIDKEKDAKEESK
jgi:hypothetical protein